MKISIEGVDGMRELVGEHLGYSDWRTITQEAVNLFAEATGDHQWIHVDPERAAKESPFGTTIAHGYLTLSLGPALLSQLMTVSGITYGLNYGLNKVRFPAPVPVGARVRAGARLAALDDVAGGVQATFEIIFELENQDKPVCVAEAVLRYYP
jgi:acyl dehydratase